MISPTMQGAQTRMSKCFGMRRFWRHCAGPGAAPEKLWQLPMQRACPRDVISLFIRGTCWCWWTRLNKFGVTALPSTIVAGKFRPVSSTAFQQKFALFETSSKHVSLKFCYRCYSWSPQQPPSINLNHLKLDTSFDLGVGSTWEVSLLMFHCVWFRWKIDAHWLGLVICLQLYDI